MTDTHTPAGDEFWLYDLKVTVQKHPDRPLVCNHQLGQYFLVQGENLIFPEPYSSFPFYSLSSMMPVFAAKQRPLQDNDWMGTDAVFACPDPHCGGLFLIERMEKRIFKHSETSGLSDSTIPPYWQK